jgi:putative spermidine/putrescine transport system substrate-binding protein
VIDGFKAKYPGITDQRAQSRRRLGRRDRGDQGQPGQHGPAGARRDRRRPGLRPLVEGRKLIQPYKVSTWDSIPDSAKDADGYWYGDYYGVLAFGVNKRPRQRSRRTTGPTSEADYANRLRSPVIRAPSNQAIQARLCRRPARAHAGGRAGGEAGLEFFAELNKAGNFVPVIGKAGDAGAGPRRRSSPPGTTTRWPGATG